MSKSRSSAENIIHQFTLTNKQEAHDAAYHNCIIAQRELLYQHIENQLPDFIDNDIEKIHALGELKNNLKIARGLFLTATKDEAPTIQKEINILEDLVANSEHEMLLRHIGLAEENASEDLKNTFPELRQLAESDVFKKMHSEIKSQIQLKLTHEKYNKIKDQHVDQVNNLSNNAQAYANVGFTLSSLPAFSANMTETAGQALSGVGGGFSMLTNAWDGYVALRDRALGQQYKTRAAVAAFNIGAGAATIGLTAAAIAAAPLALAGIAVSAAASVVYRDGMGAYWESKKADEQKIIMQDLNQQYQALKIDGNDIEKKILIEQYAYHKHQYEKHKEQRFQYKASGGFNTGYTIGATLAVVGLIFPPVAIAGIVILAATAAAKFVDVMTNNSISRGISNAFSKLKSWVTGEKPETTEDIGPAIDKALKDTQAKQITKAIESELKTDITMTATAKNQATPREKSPSISTPRSPRKKESFAQQSRPSLSTASSHIDDIKIELPAASQTSAPSDLSTFSRLTIHVDAEPTNSPSHAVSPESQFSPLSSNAAELNSPAPLSPASTTASLSPSSRGSVFDSPSSYSRESISLTSPSSFDAMASVAVTQEGQIANTKTSPLLDTLTPCQRHIAISEATFSAQGGKPTIDDAISSPIPRSRASVIAGPVKDHSPESVAIKAIAACAADTDTLKMGAAMKSQRFFLPPITRHPSIDIPVTATYRANL